MDGILVIRKEKGYTSHDVVAKLRGILHMKKIGHTGTLDPTAEGVLPVALGKGTRLVELLTEKEKRLSNAISYIEAEYHREEFDIAYLCRLMNISRSTLYRLFEEEVGCSPSEYLIRYRVTQARKMLSKGASVKSAALSCGFDDPLYFSRLFYKATGVRPSRL